MRQRARSIPVEQDVAQLMREREAPATALIHWVLAINQNRGPYTVAGKGYTARAFRAQIYVSHADSKTLQHIANACRRRTLVRVCRIKNVERERVAIVPWRRRRPCWLFDDKLR